MLLSNDRNIEGMHLPGSTAACKRYRRSHRSQPRLSKILGESRSGQNFESSSINLLPYVD